MNTFRAPCAEGGGGSGSFRSRRSECVDASAGSRIGTTSRGTGGATDGQAHDRLGLGRKLARGTHAVWSNATNGGSEHRVGLDAARALVRGGGGVSEREGVGRGVGGRGGGSLAAPRVTGPAAPTKGGSCAYIGRTCAMGRCADSKRGGGVDIGFGCPWPTGITG